MQSDYRADVHGNGSFRSGDSTSRASDISVKWSSTARNGHGMVGNIAILYITCRASEQLPVVCYRLLWRDSERPLCAEVASRLLLEIAEERSWAWL